MKSLELKKQIIMACRADLLNSIIILEEEMESLKESASADADSGMSDRLESNDEEMMNERKDREYRRDMLYRELNILDELDIPELHNTISTGTVVITNDRNFLIAIARSFKVNNMNFTGLSAQAPIFSVLEGKKAGESYSYNGTGAKIDEVFKPYIIYIPYKHVELLQLPMPGQYILLDKMENLRQKSLKLFLFLLPINGE